MSTDRGNRSCCCRWQRYYVVADMKTRRSQRDWRSRYGDGTPRSDGYTANQDRRVDDRGWEAAHIYRKWNCLLALPCPRKCQATHNLRRGVLWCLLRGWRDHWCNTASNLYETGRIGNGGTTHGDGRPIFGNGLALYDHDRCSHRVCDLPVGIRVWLDLGVRMLGRWVRVWVGIWALL